MQPLQSETKVQYSVKKQADHTINRLYVFWPMVVSSYSLLCHKGSSLAGILSQARGSLFLKGDKQSKGRLRYHSVLTMSKSSPVCECISLKKADLCLPGREEDAGSDGDQGEDVGDVPLGRARPLARGVH